MTGRAAHAGLDPERGANAAIELAHQVLAIAALGDAETGTTVTPTVLTAGTTVNTVPATRSRPGRRRASGPSLNRIGWMPASARCRPMCRGRLSRCAAAPTARRWRARRPPRCSQQAQAVAAHLGMAPLARRRGRRGERRQLHRRASACRRSTASAPSAAAPTPTTSTSSSPNSSRARGCSPGSSRGSSMRGDHDLARSGGDGRSRRIGRLGGARRRRRGRRLAARAAPHRRAPGGRRPARRASGGAPRTRRSRPSCFAPSASRAATSPAPSTPMPSSA